MAVVKVAGCAGRTKNRGKERYLSWAPDRAPGSVYRYCRRIESAGMACRDPCCWRFREGLRGSVEPGRFADRVVLSGDYPVCPETDLEQMTAKATILGGTLVYDPETEGQ